MRMNVLIGAVSELRRGGVVRLHTDMGSCRCGDTEGTLALHDGRVYACCQGNESWQNFDGLAADCKVDYGMGKLARAIARAVEHGQFRAVDCQFSTVEKYPEDPGIAAAAWQPFLMAAYAAGINPLPEIRRGLEITLHYSSGIVIFGAIEVAPETPNPKWFAADGSRWTGGVSVKVI